ncbi:MAG: hypothetical protein HYZ49_18560 [Chloroflexi bacterium]|nr:hypothetical protein [Chloroflexota bacterium]
MFADHKEALVVEYYKTGEIDTTRMKSVDAVQSHCPDCSYRQGGRLSQFSKFMKQLLFGKTK